MRRILTTAALAALSFPALAGDGSYHATTEHGRIHANAPCALFIQGLVAGSRCTMARGYGSRVSLIIVGDQQYQIRRNPGSQSARFYRTTGNMDSLIGDVYASGSCWIGSNVRFCAD
jgi:hypothetical protein